MTTSIIAFLQPLSYPFLASELLADRDLFHLADGETWAKCCNTLKEMTVMKLTET